MPILYCWHTAKSLMRCCCNKWFSFTAFVQEMCVQSTAKDRDSYSILCVWIFFDFSLSLTLVSDMFLVAKQLKGFQTLVMDPTSLLQKSLVNTVPHTIMVP